MSNRTIQIGIDLGTTNSEVAIHNSGKFYIVENILGDKLTPSVFGFSKAKNKEVGEKAFERLYKHASEEEFKNNKAEVKRLMGTSETTYFPRADKSMMPEEISAEILISLKSDVVRKYPDFDTSAAVITVPADFDTLHKEATVRAGNLAGFKHTVLLPEPIAAAIAYGFENAKDENWLVYDFGGGTFDVALISSRGGVLSVLAHNGDSYLGGKNIDWAIVDNVIVPRIVDEFSLADFRRDNEKYQSAFAKLKHSAETAKIYLSQYKKCAIEVENIGKDDMGKEIYLSIDYSRKEFEDLIRPLIDLTIEKSKDTLKEAGIGKNSVKKAILVGGPTQIPYIRQRLEEDLNIPVDSSVDPFTVVAKGACIYGMSQEIQGDDDGKGTIESGSHRLNLHYKRVTSGTEESVTGAVDGLVDSGDGYYILIQSNDKSYASSKIKLKKGKFAATVTVKPNTVNQYRIHLHKSDGDLVPIDPDYFTIIHGVEAPDTPLSHSIGIVLAKEDPKNNYRLTDVREVIFKKGSTLPLKHKGLYVTAREVKKTDSKNPLKIIIDEGESEIPDRNVFVCELGVNGDDLSHDLPQGEDVVITVNVNGSGVLSVEAYFPTFGIKIDGRETVRDEAIDIQALEVDLNIQTERAKAILEHCSPEERKAVEEKTGLTRTSISNAHTDNDERRKARYQIKDLKTTIDRIEKEKEMPQLVNEFHKELEDVQKAISGVEDRGNKGDYDNRLSMIRIEGEKAIQNNDKVLLIRINEQIRALQMEVLLSNPVAWAHLFRDLIGGYTFTDPVRAEEYKKEGLMAVERGDIDALKQCVGGLLILLRHDDRDNVMAKSGVKLKIDDTRN